MLEGGADPLYIARRLIRAASEDIGLADPTALRVALDAKDAVEAIGLPECNLALAEAALYLATAPKSNSIYKAYNRAKEDVNERRNPPVPLHLRNAPTKLMKEMGYSEGYKYAHNFEGGVADMECLPEELIGRKYYMPKEIGYEREIEKRLNYWKKMKEKQGKSGR
jgi:putative ATPase